MTTADADDGTPPALHIAYSEFAPFHWKTEDNQLAGMFYEIIQEAIQKRMGIRTVWTAYPWIRCQQNVKAGIADAILTVPTEERAQFTITHPHPIYIKKLNLFTYTGHPRLTDIMHIRTTVDIKQLGLSVITYSGNGWNKTHIEALGIKTFETPYLDNTWLMLAKRRGDLVIEWSASAQASLSRLNLSGSVIDTGTVLSTMPFHLLIGKHCPYVTILDQFDETISAMQRDGTIAEIIHRYIN